MSASPFVSIFSSRYSGHPHDGGESDDTDEEPQRYTVIENDWRGGHVVGAGAAAGVEVPGMGLGPGLKQKKKWGLKGVGFGKKWSQRIIKQRHWLAREEEVRHAFLLRETETGVLGDLGWRIYTWFSAFVVWVGTGTNFLGIRYE
jgi:hypothetical protein